MKRQTARPGRGFAGRVLVALLLAVALLLPPLVHPVPAAAQDQATGPDYWRHYNTGNSALLSDNVQALAYTEDPLADIQVPGLWIGTDRGLNYTDGHDWTAWTTEIGALPSDDVLALAVGPAGTLWVGTANGLARLSYGDPRERADDRWETTLPDSTVRALAVAGENELWAGTSAGLYRCSGAACTLYAGAPGSEACDLAYRDGILWAATEGGAGRLDVASGTWTAYHAAGSSLPSDDVRAVVVTPDGRAWLGTAGGLAALAPDGAWRTWIPRKQAGLPNFPIADLALSPGGRYLWVAMDGGGASRYDIPADAWTRFSALSSDLPNDRVQVVLASHENIAWLGTTSGLSGVERVWETYYFLSPPVPGRLASNVIISGWVDPETGTVWVGTEGGGVARSDDDGATWQTWTTAQGLGDNNIRSLWGDGAGTIWAGTSQSGVSRSDDGGATWQTLTTAQGLGSTSVSAVWGDETGIVWAGTSSGVSRTTDSGATWQTFTTAQGLASDGVQSVWGDGAGTVWVGADGGLSRTTDGGATWQTFMDNWVPHISAQTVWGDGTGAVWVGTLDLGVIGFSGATLRTFTTADGLGGNDIQTVWGDGTGAIWVGTEAGVSRTTDGGATWQTWTKADGLGSNSVQAVWGDGTGTIWVGTSSGVSRTTDGGATWQTFATAQRLESNGIGAVWGDEVGTVWVGTATGLSRTTDAGETWQTFTTVQALGSNEVSAVWGDGAGALWIGTAYGVGRTTDGGETWQTWKDTQEWGEDYIHAMWGDEAGAIWVGTAHGVSRSTDGGATWQTWNSIQGLGTGQVNALWGDGTGTVWVGTHGGGVSRTTDGGITWQTYTTADGLGDNFVSDIWGDGAGAVWAGTYGGGVSRSTDGGATWQTFTEAQGLGNNSVSAVWSDGIGAVWAGTHGGGVSRTTDGGITWQTWTTAQGLGHDWVQVVRGDRAGTVWVGTYYGGISRTTDGGETWRTFTTAQELGSNVVKSVWGDGAGAIWAGTDDGVSRTTDGGATWLAWTTAQGLGGAQVQAVWGDEVGTVWVGTNGGLSRTTDGGETWRTFTTAQGLGINQVNAVWGDGTGSVWVGTGYGVSRSTDGGATWQTFDTAQGLESYGIGAVWGDEVGTVWVGTAAGLSRTTDGGKTWQTCSTYASAQELGGSNISAVWGDGFGTIWAGTYGSGVSRTTDGGASWQTWTTAQGLGHNYVLAIWGDGRGTIWVGTWGSGVSRTTDGGATWQVFSSDQGLADPTVRSVWGDGAGTVWGGTDGGLSRLVTAAGPAPQVRWAAPQPTLTLIANRAVEVPITALSLAPSAGPETLAYSFVVSSTAGRPAFSSSLNLPVGAIGTAGTGLLTIGREQDPVPPGEYVLSLQAADTWGRSTTTHYTVRVAPPPNWTWLWLTGGALLVGIIGLLVSLRRYPAHAAGWLAARDDPLQQLIPLLARPRGRFGGQEMEPALRAAQAPATPEDVAVALAGLAGRGLLRPAGDAYRFASPWTAAVLRLAQRRNIPRLAERVRTRHPLYARTRDFFAQAHYAIDELGPEELRLSPQGSDHPQVAYGPLYARLVAGRSPTGDDFSAVGQAAGTCYGDRDLAHCVAVVVSDRRPEPGARYRLYEIRQRAGLAIVPLDVTLFGQVKPTRTANDILAAEIDQATGQQDLYAISSPVSSDLSFFGRERVLQEIVDLLDAGQPVGLFGLRKVGKTSLLQRLQGQLGRRRPIALVDTQGTARQQGAWPLYPAVVAALAEHLRQYRPDVALSPLRLAPPPETAGPEAAAAFLPDLRALHEALGRPGEQERLLLIVDEVDRLLPAGETPGYAGFAEFFAQLRAANQQARLLDLLLVGVDPAINRRERWADHDNELYRALREVWLPPMDPEDVREMVESLGSQMGVRYEPEALARLVEAGGGQPFVTRQLCSRAVQGWLGRGAITVTAAEADKAIEDFVFQDPYPGELWRTRLDEAQREMLRTLARAAVPVPRTQLLPVAQRQEALASLGALEEYTLLRREAGGYTIAWPVLRLWVRWVELGFEA